MPRDIQHPFKVAFPGFCRFAHRDGRVRARDGSDDGASDPGRPVHDRPFFAVYTAVKVFLDLGHQLPRALRADIEQRVEKVLRTCCPRGFAGLHFPERDRARTGQPHAPHPSHFIGSISMDSDMAPNRHTRLQRPQDGHFAGSMSASSAPK